MRTSDEIFYNWIVEGKYNEDGVKIAARVMAIDARRAMDEFIKHVGKGASFNGEITSIVRDGEEVNGEVKYYNYSPLITTPTARATEKRLELQEQIALMTWSMVNEDHSEADIQEIMEGFVDEVLIKGFESK